MKEDFYKKLLDNASDLIWAIDMEGTFIYINDNIKEWGYDKNELIGKPLLNILNTRHIGKRESEPSVLGFLQSYEMEIMDKRGQAHAVIVKSSPLQNDNGDVIGVMGIIRDVTETLILEEKLKNEARLASLGRLATGIAHEIRNPLSSVKMNLAILRKRLKPEGVDVEHFNIAQEEVDNLEKIVTELLDYAKPITLKLQRKNLRKEIEAVLATVETICKKRKITISSRFDEDTPLAFFDAGKIHQALLNVVLNAIQASHDGNAIEIETIMVNDPPTHVRIMVTDHGSGIEPENMRFIFDPFFSTSKNGSGLGLSIVRNIMNNHKGSIRLESVPGRGTTAIMELPVN